MDTKYACHRCGNTKASEINIEGYIHHSFPKALHGDVQSGGCFNVKDCRRRQRKLTKTKGN